MKITPRTAAGALIAAAGLHMVVALAAGRSARAEIPVDLTPPAAEARLDVWRAAAGLVEAGSGARVLDVRPADAFARWHLPGAESAAGASPAEVAARAAGVAFVLVYAETDASAERLVHEARRAAPGARIHWLEGGARAWYLALALPVPLFAEAPPPPGYGEAIARVQGWLARPDPAARGDALAALQVLSRASYQPDLLRTGARPRPASGAAKKIAGGCG